MEHHVIIQKLCSCAKKGGLEQIKSYSEKPTALEAAKIQLEMMESTFCGKHSFDITEVNDHYVIGMIEGGCGCGTHEKH